MSGELIKGLIGKEDFSLQYNTNAAETASRLASAGGTQNITKFPDIWGYTGAIRPGDIITKGPWIDVRAYGAKGDGVTDDTAAIQAAIAAAANKILFYPPGTYLGTYTIPNTVTVILSRGASLTGTVTNNGTITTMGSRFEVESGVGGAGNEIARFIGNGTAVSFISVMNSLHGDDLQGTIGAYIAGNGAPFIGIGANSNDPLVLISNDSERMRLDQYGNLGFGNGTTTSLGTLKGGWNVGVAGTVFHAYNPAVNNSDTIFVLSSGGTRFPRLIFENLVSTVGNRVVSLISTADTFEIDSLNEANGNLAKELMKWDTKTGWINIPTVMRTYANNTDAVNAGLSVGDLYKTSTGQLMIVY